MKAPRPLVLIADDERDIRFILRDVLESEGYAIAEAADGGEARAAVRRDRPALVLLDVRLPVTDGMTLLQELRAEGIDMGIVIMTAHGNERLAVKAMKSGADDYLPKPFHPDDIIFVVDRVLRHRELERRSAELSRQVERDKRRLEAILAQMAQGLLTTGPDLVVGSCNPGAEAILGRPPDAIVGRPLAELFPRPFAGTPPWTLPEAFSSGAGAEAEVIAPDGAKRPILLSLGRIAAVEGEEPGAIAVFQDLTRIKSLEHEKEEFVSMVAHDLKGPLTSVFATLELLLDGTLGDVTPKQREFLDIAHVNTRKIQRMIDTFLEAYRMEAGKVPFAITHLNPTLVIAQVHERYVPVARERDIELVLLLEPQLPPVLADADHFSRIIDNLLSNAFKYIPDGGRIELSAGRDPDEPGRLLRVVVSDNGPGIAEADLPRIFEKFRQGRRGKGTSGIGLGLAYTRMAVERHGGRIAVSSAEGKGASFSFTIPFAPPRGS